MDPVHPDLLSLATVAKTFGRTLCIKGKVGQPELAAVLRNAVGRRSAWLRPEHRIGDPARYMRHLLYVDPDDDFVITAITWLPGQQSAVHGHYVWCAFGVAEGELAEETFRVPGKLLEPLGTRTIHAGELAQIDLGGPLYHRVSNRTLQPLVTLHVYGVAAGSLTTGINRLYGEA